MYFSYIIYDINGFVSSSSPENMESSICSAIHRTHQRFNENGDYKGNYDNRTNNDYEITNVAIVFDFYFTFNDAILERNKGYMEMWSDHIF